MHNDSVQKKKELGYVV